ncbi:class I SAM-dependent methyltransferase [bacterium]|nr:class I SAM-dependent methyltransferase [bacterium]
MKSLINIIKNMFRLPYTMEDNVPSDVIFPGSVIATFNYIIHLSRYVFSSRFTRGKEVLEVGCGTGYGASYLIRKGAKMIIAGDISQEGLQIARDNYKKHNLEFIELNAECLALEDNSFDVVISFGVIDHLANAENHVSESKRVLRKNGSFLCSTSNKQLITPFFTKKPVDPLHGQEFTPIELFQLIDKYFSNVELRGLAYLSPTWWKIRSWAYYAFNKLKLIRFGMIIVRLLRPGAYRTIVYSEDKVDEYFKKEIEWDCVTSDSQSRAIIFMVIGTKK